MSAKAEPMDISAALHLWDDLFTANVKLALSTEGDGPEERRKARERFLAGYARSLRERDEKWVRIAERLEAAGLGR